MKLRALLACILFLFPVSMVLSRSLWTDKNIYATSDKFNVGDIIILNIADITSMQFDLTVGSNDSFSISSNPDKNITAFLPKVSGDKQIKVHDKTSYSTKGKIKFTMATRVLNKAAGASYAIAGSKTFTVNGITSIITVAGLVDPALVKGRTVESNNVADFYIEIKGVKEGITIKREKLKEGEKIDTNLTDEEKQKIIIDYLQKMLGELTR